MSKEETKLPLHIKRYIKRGLRGAGRKHNVKVTPRGTKEEISNFMASDSFIQIFYYTIKHLSVTTARLFALK